LRPGVCACNGESARLVMSEEFFPMPRGIQGVGTNKSTSGVISREEMTLGEKNVTKMKYPFS